MITLKAVEIGTKVVFAGNVYTVTSNTKTQYKLENDANRDMVLIIPKSAREAWESVLEPYVEPMDETNIWQVLAVLEHGDHLYAMQNRSSCPRCNGKGILEDNLPDIVLCTSCVPDKLYANLNAVYRSALDHPRNPVPEKRSSGGRTRGNNAHVMPKDAEAYSSSGKPVSSAFVKAERAYAVHGDKYALLLECKEYMRKDETIGVKEYYSGLIYFEPAYNEHHASFGGTYNVDGHNVVLEDFPHDLIAYADGKKIPAYVKTALTAWCAPILLELTREERDAFSASLAKAIGSKSLHALSGYRGNDTWLTRAHNWLVDNGYKAA